MDVMVDLETLDIEITAAVISIGAVFFDCEGDGIIGETFHRNIIWETVVDHDAFTVSEDTVKFWERQNADAIEALFDPEPVPYLTALQDFHSYVKNGNPSRIWANPPRFDIGMLRYSCDVLETPFPMTPWVEMCVRTLKNLMPKEYLPKKTGTNHNPVDDCKWQVEMVQLFHQMIGGS